MITLTMKIEMIAHTVSSNRDVNGNCYHSCCFTFTATGERVVVGNIGGLDGNGLPMRLFDDHDKTYKANESIPIREYQRHRKFSTEPILFEHEALPVLQEALKRARKTVTS